MFTYCFEAVCKRPCNGNKLLIFLRRPEMLLMGRRSPKNVTKKREKLVIEFDERKRAYVKGFM